MSRARRARSSGSWPASRRPTYLCTVLWSVPASSAADLAHRDRSNASSISMISSFFLVKTLPPTWTTTFQSTYGSAIGRSGTGVLLSALGEISCPPVGTFLSAYGENDVSAVICVSARLHVNVGARGSKKQAGVYRRSRQDAW